MATCSGCGSSVQLSRRDVEMIDTMISMRLAQVQMPIARDGIIASGSYSPKDGHVSIIYGDTATMFPDTSDEMINHPKIPMAVMHYGDQYGPVGDERAVVIEAQGGPVALIIYDEDDSPGAPAGERWITHRSPATGVVNHSSKWTNDGASAGDGLGSQVHSGFGLHEVTTAGGLSTTHNDATKQIKKSANAQTYTIWDAEGNAISHVAADVGLGDLVANMDATHAAFRKTDADTLAAGIKKMVGNALQQSAQAAIGAGVTNATAWLAAIQAGLPSLSFTDLSSSIAELTAPDGSTVVKIK